MSDLPDLPSPRSVETENTRLWIPVKPTPKSIGGWRVGNACVADSFLELWKSSRCLCRYHDLESCTGEWVYLGPVTATADVSVGAGVIEARRVGIVQDIEDIGFDDASPPACRFNAQ